MTKADIKYEVLLTPWEVGTVKISARLRRRVRYLSMNFFHCIKDGMIITVKVNGVQVIRIEARRAEKGDE